MIAAKAQVTGFALKWKPSAIAGEGPEEDPLRAEPQANHQGEMTSRGLRAGHLACSIHIRRDAFVRTTGLWRAQIPIPGIDDVIAVNPVLKKWPPRGHARACSFGGSTLSPIVGGHQGARVVTGWQLPDTVGPSRGCLSVRNR